MQKWIFYWTNFILGKCLPIWGYGYGYGYSYGLMAMALLNLPSFTDADYTCDYNAVVFLGKCKIINL